MSHEIYLLRKGSPDFLKLIFAVIATVYFSRYILDSPYYSFLDNVNLMIHEAGHVFFMFFGDFLRVSGGTILQLFVPFVFILYFYFKKEKFSAFVVLFWLGQNFINVSVYMGDAVARKLPLLGGNSVNHDWHYLLSRLNLLHLTDILASITFSIGALIIALAAILCFCNALKISFKFKNSNINY